MNPNARPTRFRRAVSLSLTAIGFLAFAQAASAQGAAQTSGSPAISLVGGINFARLSLPLPPAEFDGLTISATNKSRVGFVGGVLVDFDVTPRAGFVTGGLISTKGAGMDVTIPGFGTASGTIRMIYIDVPVLGRFRVMGSKDCDISLLAGGVASFRANARNKFSFMGESASESFTDDVAVFDFGVTVGARVDFGRANVIAYYTHGLLDSSGGDAAESIRHRVVSVIAGWRF